MASMRNSSFQSLQLDRRRADRIEAEAQAKQAQADFRARILHAAGQQSLSELLASGDPALRALGAEFSKCVAAEERKRET